MEDPFSRHPKHNTTVLKDGGDGDIDVADRECGDGHDDDDSRMMGEDRDVCDCSDYDDDFDACHSAGCDAVDVEDDGHMCDLALRIIVDTLLITYPPMQGVLASDMSKAQT